MALRIGSTLAAALRVGSTEVTKAYLGAVEVYAKVVAAVSGAADTFNRADSTSTLGAADTGGAWTAHTGTWGIAGNRAALVTPTNNNASPWNIATVNAGLSSCACSVNFPTAWSDGLGIVFRATDATNYWLLRFNASGAGVQLYKVVAGGVTFVVAPSATLNATGNTLGVVLIGSTIQIKVNGADAGSPITDSTHATATRHGLWNNGGPGTSTSGGYPGAGAYDNFSVTTAATVVDTFTRADNASSLGTADTGQAWTAHAGTWGITGGQATAFSGVDISATVDAGSADVDVSVTLAALQGGGGEYSGLTLRYVDANNRIRLYLNGGTGSAIVARYRIAGVQSDITLGGTWAAGDVLRAVVVGSSLAVYRNGTLVGTRGDAPHVTATRHGLHAESYGGGIRFDDFSVKTATTITDTFTRADNASSLGSTDTGQAWTVLSGTWGIASNRASNTPPGGANVVAVVDGGSANQVVQARIYTVNAGYVYRAIDDANHFMVSVNSSGNGTIYRKTAGGYTVLGGITASAAAGSLWQVEVVGSQHRYYVNGTFLVSLTDSAHSTGTRAGFNNFSSTATFDDFTLKVV